MRPESLFRPNPPSYGGIGNFYRCTRNRCTRNRRETSMFTSYLQER
jgi:hypothetical protein